MNTRRKQRRAKVQKLCLIILETEKDGIDYRHLASLINKAVSRVSIHNLSHLMKPYLDDGTITRHTTYSDNRRNYFWKLK